MTERLSPTMTSIFHNLLRRSRQFAKKFAIARKANRLCIRLGKSHAAPRNYNKVFCVGWLKTGTSSLGIAMKRLGFKHRSFDVDIWLEWYEKGHIDKVVQYARHFDSFDDLPWNKIEILEKLDKEYPNSKFVLLERESESWFQSFKEFRIRQGKGDIVGDKEKEIEEYERRNSFIKHYFTGPKENQLLVMNVMAGEGYEKLCSFLELPVLDEPFPHVNKRKLR